ncbi:hypothetical protein QOZ80_5BG0423130 [Eleusine coracana subsp. coracana]|nr:hypothetical protein QOZ80_5BG0423130 [Eleusine coracana subsp. coracana]
MACRTLELTLVSARDLRAVTHVSKMEVYAVVYLPTDRAGGRSPSWSNSGGGATVHVTVPASGAGCGAVRVLLRSERALGDRDVGEVILPLRDIVAGAGDDDGPTEPTLLCVPVCRVGSSKHRHGVLNLSYRLGRVVSADAMAPKAHQEPLLAKPVDSSSPSTAYLAAAASVYSAARPTPYRVAPLGVACTGTRHAQ